MATSLYGKLAIITGSARGFGRGFAEAVLRDGGKVVICDVLEEEGKSTAEGFQAVYGKEKVSSAEVNNGMELR